MKDSTSKGIGRQWGPWTEVKLDALGRYLVHFTTASQKARRTLYLDLFAGASDNVERRTRRSILSSVQRALDAKPMFSKVVACELQPQTARHLKEDLRGKYPDRDFDVLDGDCNKSIPALLGRLPREWRYAPTFAFIDQFSAEIHWSTLEALSKFRLGDNKVELLMFFGDALLPRGLGIEPATPTDEAFVLRVNQMYGTDEWKGIWRGRRERILTAPQFRDELVNLMRWRLEHDLGYRFTLPLRFTNEHGGPIYTVIFATDHLAGERIMTSVFRLSDQALADMRAAGKARKRREKEMAQGVDGLFANDPEDGTLYSTQVELNPHKAAVVPWLHPDER